MRKIGAPPRKADSKNKIGPGVKYLSLRRRGTFSAFRRFTQSPAFNVLALVVIFLGVFAGVRLLRARHEHAQLSFVERNNEDVTPSANTDPATSAPPELFSGEVYDTSIRLRETAAFGIAMSLTVFAEYAEKGSIPPTLDNAIASIARRNLLPPAFILDGGEVSSPSSTLIVRYQSQPLRFEILSRPKPQTQGPALMIRFPLAAVSGKNLSYFQSSVARRYESPAPFAASDQVIAAGWTIEQWRGEILPFDKGLISALGEEQKLWNTK